MTAVIASPLKSEVVRAFEAGRVIKHNPYIALTSADSESESVSSIGYDDRVAPFDPIKVSFVPQTVADVRSPREWSREELVTVFSLGMSYLPLEDIETVRTAAPILAEAADYVAPHPFNRSDIVFVRWEPTEVPHPVRLPPLRKAIPGAPSNFSWRCLACGSLTYGPRSCATCRAPINGSSCRVFLGQLRKDLTAELTAYLLRSVLPDVEILHIESHTNPSDGRGRGCAWVYVDSVAAALRVTEVHKRLFIDVDAFGCEGFWFVRDPQLTTALCLFADSIGSARGRPLIMPRQPVVAELPGKSLIADIVNESRH
jgi:hypothetical protein